jgi:hypothetical protein
MLQAKENIMKKECDTEAGAQSIDEQPWRKVVAKLLGGTVESRPIVTCECALWGSPCPHSFWSEKKATASASKPA